MKKPTVLESLRQSVVPPRTAAEAEQPSAPRQLSGARRKCSFDLPIELADDLRVLAAVQGIKQRQVIEALVAAYVRQHKALLPNCRSA